MFIKAYISTFKLFPENNLDHNSELAWIVTSKFLEIPYKKEINETNNDEINKLYEFLASDEWVRKTISNSYRLDAFYYSYENSSDLLKHKIDDALKKAKSYDDMASPISSDELGSIDRKIKREVKELKKNVKKLNSERIEKEKQKVIKPVTVTLSHVLSLFSLFSILFLISGYIYNKFLLGALGINSSDFFAFSDYISSSADVIESSLISSALGVITYIVGANDALSKKLLEEQFNIEKVRNYPNYLIALAISVPIFSLAVTLFIKRELPDNVLDYFYPLIFFILFYIVHYLPIWNYVRNWFAVSVVITTIFVFLISLGWAIIEDIEDVKNRDYKSSYTISFKKGYEEYSGHMFFASNSNYVFLLNKENQKISVIPKSGIKALHTKYNGKDDSLNKTTTTNN